MYFQLEKSVWNVSKDAAKQRPILSFSVMTESRAYGRREEAEQGMAGVRRGVAYI